MEIIVGILGVAVLVLVVNTFRSKDRFNELDSDIYRLRSRIGDAERKLEYQTNLNIDLRRTKQALKFLLEKDTEVAQYLDFTQEGVIQGGRKPNLYYCDDLELLIREVQNHTRVREAVQCKPKCKQGKKK